MNPNLDLPRRQFTPGPLRAALLGLILSALPAGASPRYSATQIALADGTPLILLHDEAGGIEAAVAPTQGGELSGLRVRYRGAWHELLYRARSYANAPGWRGKAPVLWPAVGRNFAAGDHPTPGATDCSYDLEGRRYRIPIHGFARFKAWRIAAVGADLTGARATLELTDDPGTRTTYPFGFVLSVACRVEDGGMTLAYRVLASGENPRPMPFSIGNHLTFRVPLVAGSAPAGVTVQSPSRLEILKDPNGLPTGEVRPQSFASPMSLTRLDLGPAISLGGYAGDPWLKIADPSGLTIRVSHHADSLPDSRFVQFNLWGNLQAGFFSPEPWVGLQNSLNLHEGLIQLAPGRSWNWVIRIEPGRAAEAAPAD